jgi:hypothetical protein
VDTARRTSRLSRPRHPQLEGTAYHESGHAVVANVLGLGPSTVEVSIEPNSDSLGRVQFSGHNDLIQHPSGLVDGLVFEGFGPWQRIERLIMETWAGPLAATRLGAELWASEDDGLDADWKTINCLAQVATQTTSEGRPTSTGSGSKPSSHSVSRMFGHRSRRWRGR